MYKSLFPLLWAVPLLFSSADAWAWGLYTHVYFAQLILWTVPLLDPRFRAALRRFPRRVLAGACLPDLALFGRRAGTEAFDATHRWSTAERLLREARDEGERALALGFASHLLADVIAHNHFVPSHQELWLDVPVLTHALSEWAMDHHLSREVLAKPRRLLHEDFAAIARYAARHFGCGERLARRALAYLARAEGALRLSGIPEACHRWGRRLDRDLPRRFDYYVGETARRLEEINRVLEGERPAWGAEIPEDASGIASAEHLARLFDEQRPLPIELFGTPREAAAAAGL